jgi:hypothetical protein
MPPGPQPLPEIRHLDAARFQAIRAASRPVVLRGIAARWPLVRAAEGWMDALRAFATTDPVEFARADPDIDGRLHYDEAVRAPNFERGRTSLPAFLDELAALATHPRPHSIAVQGLSAARHLPGFHEAHPLAVLPPAIAPRVWIGNRAKVAIHHDPSENVAVVAAGRRRFTLFPPEQVGNLYMGPFHVTPAGTPVSMVHLTQPDLDRFPRFADALAAAEFADLAAGDAVYIPYQWYHHVEALASTNMLVNYWWDPARRDVGSPADAMLHGMMTLRNLPPDQRRAWRAMFDHYVFLENGDPGEHLPDHARGVLDATSPADVAAMRRGLLASLHRDMGGK